MCGGSGAPTRFPSLVGVWGDRVERSGLKVQVRA